MKRRIYEKGDVMAVVFAVLVVLLMTALGIIFYQNIVVKKTDTTSQPSGIDTSKQQTATADVAFLSDIYKMDHPSNWEAVAKKPQADDKVQESSLTITSPDKTIQVVFRIFEGGIGWSCDPEDGLKLRHYTVHTQSVKGLTKSPLYLVEAMSDYKDGGYRYDIGLAPDGGMTHASIGDSHCTVMNLGTLTDIGLGGTAVNAVAKIDFPKLSHVKDSKVASMDEIKDILSTDDYKTAVTILESIRKE